MNEDQEVITQFLIGNCLMNGLLRVRKSKFGFEPDTWCLQVWVFGVWLTLIKVTMVDSELESN